MKTNIEKIKTLRKRTQVSYMECKKALEQSNYDIESAERILMEKGLKIIASGSNNSDVGLIGSYIHPGNRVGVMVEICCETDFVAKTEEVKQFTKDITMQIASMRPKYISRDDIDDELSLNEYDRRTDRLIKEGYSDDKLSETVNDEINQWFAEICLLEQTYIKDNSKIVKELLAELINKVGESCKIKRFVRWEIGNNNGEIKVSKNKKEEKSSHSDTEISRTSGFFGKLLLLVLASAVIFTVLLNYFGG